MNTAEDFHVLPADMRAEACGELFDLLKVSRGQPITLNASAVERMDTLSAQLFVLAAKTWANDGLSFNILEPSERVLQTMDRLGLSAHLKLEGISYDK